MKSKKVISVLLAFLIMFNLFIPTYAQAGINDNIKIEQTQVEENNSSSDVTDESSSNSVDSSSSNSNISSSDIADESSSNSTDSSSSDSNSSSSDVVDEFVPLTVLNSENDTVIAEIGEEVTLTASVNRNDVSVDYQWQKMQMAIPKKEVKVEPIFDYPEGSPTWYNFPLEDKTENQVISENPNATWMGVEMYFATINALNEIGANSSNVSFEWKTPNLVLDGYTISAEIEEDIVKIIATKDDKELVATLNENNKLEFENYDFISDYCHS